MKLLGKIAPVDNFWKGQGGVTIIHLEASSIKGLPPDVEAGDLPLRVRINSKLTSVSGSPTPGKTAIVEGTLVLNEVYKGDLKPPHIDAVLVEVVP